MDAPASLRSLPPRSFPASLHRLIPALALLGVAASLGLKAEFAIEEKPGQQTDVRYRGHLVARYMHAYDPESRESLHETYKPYLHIFDPEGGFPITKGPGGQFSHHRGIFIGWNRITVGSTRYDLWHMSGGPQIHRKFLVQKSSPEAAVLAAQIDWVDKEGHLLIQEARTMTFGPLSAPGIVSVDFATQLTTQRDHLRLDGDPNHAGVQYRPSDDVDRGKTVYVFPRAGADPKVDQDYPWVGETHTLQGKAYSVVMMNHPSNPEGTVFSAYRDYGRFGAFFKRDLKRDDKLTLQYRFLIFTGGMPDIDAIQKQWDEFAGRPAAAVPDVTVIGQGGEP